MYKWNRGDRETINYGLIIGLFVGQVISQQQMICGQNWFIQYIVCTYLDTFEFLLYQINIIFMIHTA